MRGQEKQNLYLQHFGLRAQPFSVTPDPRFFVQSGTHLESLASLIYGIKERKGFILLSGPVGSGKTTLIRTLLEQVDSNVVFSHIFNTDVDSLELLKMICSDFGLSCNGKGRAELFSDLFDFLIEARLAGQNALVVVDEAQNLSEEALESLRMLSNLETPREKILQILLCGQPELLAKLQRGSLRQLAQRIVIFTELHSLTEVEVERYIYHRMQLCGARGDKIIPPPVTKKVAELSGGVPRLVNILCDNSLMLAFAEGKHEVSEEILDKAGEQCIGLGAQSDQHSVATGFRVSEIKERLVDKVPDEAKEKIKKKFGFSLLKRISSLFILPLLGMVFVSAGLFPVSNTVITDSTPVSLNRGLGFIRSGSPAASRARALFGTRCANLLKRGV